MGGLQARRRRPRSALGIHALGSMRVTRDGVEQTARRRPAAASARRLADPPRHGRIGRPGRGGRVRGRADRGGGHHAPQLRGAVAPGARRRRGHPGTRLPARRGRPLPSTSPTSRQASRLAALRSSGRIRSRAVERLSTALALWHGEAYAEFADEPWAYPESQRLAELRLTAEELLVEAELACGHAAQVLPTIEALCREHPLREAFRGQLMTAYYRAGRQADALAVFRGFRDRARPRSSASTRRRRSSSSSERILAQDPELLARRGRGEPLRGYRLGERLGTGRDGTVHAAHAARRRPRARR